MAVRAAFPHLRRVDLVELLRRFRRLARRRAQRHQSRLEWRRPGAVWAADFKERREPLEGRYGWILSIKDLGSGFQLAWQPLVEATAYEVQAIYAELFAEHGPPLVMKSDNGGQFKADETKGLLAEHRVIPLYSPKRHPQYNGGVERAIALIESFYNSDKVVAAVCHSSAVFHRVMYQGAPLVKGKRVTGFTNGEEATVQLTHVVPFLVEGELKKIGGLYEKAADWESLRLSMGVW